MVYFLAKHLPLQLVSGTVFVSLNAGNTSLSFLYQWVIETMEKSGSEWVGVRREPFNSAKAALSALHLVVKDPRWKYRLVLFRYEENGLGLIVR